MVAHFRPRNGNNTILDPNRYFGSFFSHQVFFFVFILVRSINRLCQFWLSGQSDDFLIHQIQIDMPKSETMISRCGRYHHRFEEEEANLIADDDGPMVRELGPNHIFFSFFFAGQKCILLQQTHSALGFFSSSFYLLRVSFFLFVCIFDNEFFQR